MQTLQGMPEIKPVHPINEGRHRLSCGQQLLFWGIGALSAVSILVIIDSSTRAKYEASVATIYKTWVPVHHKVKQGQWVYFKHTGVTLRPNVILQIVDGFKNLDTGTQYPDGVGARITNPSKGADLQSSARFIQPDLPPGRYILMGYAQPLGRIRAAASWYQSKPFLVTPSSMPIKAARHALHVLGRK